MIIEIYYYEQDVMATIQLALRFLIRLCKVNSYMYVMVLSFLFLKVTTNSPLARKVIMQ